MRKRDYKAEYQRRKARAKAKGFRGYYQQRKFNRAVKDTSRDLAERLDDIGILEWEPFQPGAEPDSIFNQKDFWTIFRQYYDRQAG